MFHNYLISAFSCDSFLRRDPLALINGKKKKDKEITSEELNTEVENNKPKATRHIFLIRHSQYNLNGSVDKERVLTPLGMYMNCIDYSVVAIKKVSVRRLK